MSLNIALKSATSGLNAAQMGLRVISDNLVEIRICNEAGAQQSISDFGVRLTTLR